MKTEIKGIQDSLAHSTTEIYDLKQKTKILELESCKIKDIGVAKSNDIEILVKGET